MAKKTTAAAKTAPKSPAPARPLYAAQRPDGTLIADVCRLKGDCWFYALCEAHGSAWEHGQRNALIARMRRLGWRVVAVKIVPV